VRDVLLSEYTPELKETIQVWVNPPVSTLSKLADYFREQADRPDAFDDFLGVLSDLLSQGRDETHWTVDELKGLIDGTAETDPGFWFWFQERVAKEISDYRTVLKKV
jgi:hypothetical protein